MKAIIVEDELNCGKTLSALLERHCEGVEVVRICRNGQEGIEAIKVLSPDIVFLDVEMPAMNGFEMLERLPAINFHLIFTTSYDQYAIKAFRFSAIDYLLKPVDKDDLKAAVEKVFNRTQKPEPAQLEILFDRIKHPTRQIKKLALPTLEGLQMVSIDSIIYAEADDNYTILHFHNQPKLIVSLVLKEVEESLEEFAFARVHRGYIVNLNEIEKYVKGEGGYLVMSDRTTIDVSRTKKESLLKRLLSKK